MQKKDRSRLLLEGYGFCPLGKEKTHLTAFVDSSHIGNSTKSSVSCTSFHAGKPCSAADVRHVIKWQCCLRYKNMPLLVGKSGMGKTTIARQRRLGKPCCFKSGEQGILMLLLLTKTACLLALLLNAWDTVREDSYPITSKSVHICPRRWDREGAEIFVMILQVLDNGKLTDGQGEFDFSWRTVQKITWQTLAIRRSIAPDHSKKSCGNTSSILCQIRFDAESCFGAAEH